MAREMSGGVRPAPLERITLGRAKLRSKVSKAPPLKKFLLFLFLCRSRNKKTWFSCFLFAGFISAEDFDRVRNVCARKVETPPFFFRSTKAWRSIGNGQLKPLLFGCRATRILGCRAISPIRKRKFDQLIYDTREV